MAYMSYNFTCVLIWLFPLGLFRVRVDLFKCLGRWYPVVQGYYFRFLVILNVVRLTTQVEVAILKIHLPGMGYLSARSDGGIQYSHLTVLRRCSRTLESKCWNFTFTLAKWQFRKGCWDTGLRRISKLGM